MKTYIVTSLLCLTLIFLAAVAGAQTKAPADSSQDIGVRLEDTSCSKMAIQSLRDAVDPQQQANQDWNLKAAQAYRDLAALGQSC